MAGWGLFLLLCGQCFIALGEDSRDLPDWKAEDWKPLFFLGLPVLLEGFLP